MVDRLSQGNCGKTGCGQKTNERSEWRHQGNTRQRSEEAKLRSRALQVESRHRAAVVAAMLRQTVGGRDDFGVQRQHKLAGEISGKPLRIGRKAGAPLHRVNRIRPSQPNGTGRRDTPSALTHRPARTQSSCDYPAMPAAPHPSCSPMTTRPYSRASR